jgi:hypothetical protein
VDGLLASAMPQLTGMPEPQQKKQYPFSMRRIRLPRPTGESHALDTANGLNILSAFHGGLGQLMTKVDASRRAESAESGANISSS